MVLAIPKQSQYNSLSESSILFWDAILGHPNKKPAQIFAFRLQEVEQLLIEFKFPVGRVIKRACASERVPMGGQDG
jgi:hypothetical protein